MTIARAAVGGVLEMQVFALRLTDREPMARLRARISAGFMVLGWGLPSLSALAQPGGLTEAKAVALLLLAPMPFMAGPIDTADKGLYDAKKTGRNRVVAMT